MIQQELRADAGELRPGALIGSRYRVDRVIGTGAMGVVVAATHVELEERVAIKLLHTGAARSTSVARRFVREARAAARLKGDHVVRILDIDQPTDAPPFIVMEYLDGHDLKRELTRRAPLSVEDAVDYALQICAGLAEAHRHNIVHRDIKPANVFLARTPSSKRVAKLVDFGISKMIRDGEDQLTGSLAAMGTPAYMAP